jgi:hypothetical protein
MQYVGEHGIVRPRDIEAIGLPRQYLVRLRHQGKLKRPGRGILHTRGRQGHGTPLLRRGCEACTQSGYLPTFVPCISRDYNSESRFGLDSSPQRGKKASPRFASLRIVRLSGLSLTKGIENHQVDGVPVRVYSAAKTVADCFKFRNKIGLDIAIESLKDCLRQKKASINEIYRYAKVCRVSNVIRPYMEAL